jgi:peptidoglycan hydrolase-like protein with peptidoglycan-binding domain
LSVLGTLRGRIAILGGVIVVLLAAGTWIALTHASAQPTVPVSADGHASAPPKATPLSVVSVTPAEHAKEINGAAPVKITFSAALASDSPMPEVTPHIAGHWQKAGADAVEFVPTRGFGEWTHVKVHIPGGPAGLQASDGGQLAHGKTVKFETGGYSSERLAEVLAQLGYLPLTWTATSGQAAPGMGDSGQEAAAFTPPAGTYAWKPGYPHHLRDYWDSGSPSGLIVRGAVMAFESQHDLTMDGIAGKDVWKVLLKAATKDEADSYGYTYALASEHLPETLSVWHDGHRILHTLANTGIPAAPTTLGTAPVYLKYKYQVMRGKNPDGSKYADPVWYVSYFRAGEAVHYFSRGSYGFQQSLGCVELPMSEAKYIWPYLTFGTLVTVTTAKP